MKIDNFALTMFQACPAKYLLRIREGWVPRRRRAALGFGGGVHVALAKWYSTPGEPAERAKTAIEAMVAAWPENMPTDDYRTREKAVQVFLDYIKTYPQEQFEVVGYPDIPLVERAFTLPTGRYLECDECGLYMDPEDEYSGVCSNCGQPLEPVEYGGIIDAGVTFGDQVYVLEHKTTSMLGPTYFYQYKPNNQVTGYIWALSQLTSKKVGGAVINAIGAFKSSPNRFERNITNRFPAEIKEWLDHVVITCNEIKRCERTGVWPWRTGSCMQYGMCDYHSVHVLAEPAERIKRLEQDYQLDQWHYEERDDAKD